MQSKHGHKNNYHLTASASAANRYGHFYDHPITCSNCQCLGHTSKYCPQPITSYGVIVFRVRSEWNQAAILTSTEKQAFTGLEPVYDSIEFLMIQRRDSIGFVEIMRGKYKITDTEYIIKQFAGMTATERERLKVVPFEQLWEDLWGVPTHIGNTYKHEKEVAKQKLEGIRAGEAGMTIEEINLRAGPAFETPEWGFPKGRRDPYESDYKCAMRELWEETNLKEGDVLPIQGLEPITETFFGSNQVHYCHKYFIAYAPPSIADSVNYEQFCKENVHMQREIGGLEWVNANEALQRIRADSVEKKEILLRVCSLLKNYCPLRLS